MIHNTTASVSAGTATILPGAPAGYLWRPAELEDAAAIYELRIAADEADVTDVAGSLDEAKRDFGESWTNSATHSLLGFDRFGELVTSARIFINPEETDEYRVHLIGEIHPRQRRRGLGRFLSLMGLIPRCLRRDYVGTVGQNAIEDMIAQYVRNQGQDISIRNYMSNSLAVLAS